MAQKNRLPGYLFDLPVQELRRGYRSDVYFWRAKMALESQQLHPSVTMQVFQKKEAVLCGMDEAIAILRVGSGRYREGERASRLFDRFLALKPLLRRARQEDPDACPPLGKERDEVARELDGLWEEGFSSLRVEALHDGERISPWETVMHITGDAGLFLHLETVYLGVLARRTRIATQVRRVVAAAAGKKILFFPARFDHWAAQGGDGYAAQVGGAVAVSTDAQAEWWGGRGSGTIPHALIAAVDGDTVRAAELFSRTYPDTPLVALVDYDNDVVAASLACARAFGPRLWGVRLDTSENLVDRSVVPLMGSFRPTGVVPELVALTRRALDREGFSSVKIVVSGGFDPEKISRFERAGAPVDAYGVGSSLLQEANDFTADVVLREGKPCAKSGRSFQPNPRLVTVGKEA